MFCDVLLVLINRIWNLGLINESFFRLLSKLILLVLLFRRCLFFSCLSVFMVFVRDVCLVNLFVCLKVFFLKGIVILVFLLFVLKKVFRVVIKVLIGVSIWL